MKRELSAVEAHQKFGELLNQAYYQDDQIIIKQEDKPIAALISIRSYQQFLKQRDKDFSVLDRVWGKVPDVPEDEVEQDIAVAIAEVQADKADSLNQDESI